MAPSVQTYGPLSTEGYNRLNKIDYNKIDYNKIVDKIETNSGTPSEYSETPSLDGFKEGFNGEKKKNKKLGKLKDLSQEDQFNRYNYALKLEKTLMLLLTELSMDLEEKSRKRFHRRIKLLVDRELWAASERDLDLIYDIQSSLYLDDELLEEAAEQMALDIASIFYNVKTFNFGSILAGARALLKNKDTVKKYTNPE